DGPGSGDVALDLEEAVGVVSCAITHGSGSSFARFGLPRLPSESGEAKATDLLARALGLEVAEIGFDGHRPTIFGAGLPFTFVPIRALGSLANIRLDASLWGAAFGGAGRGAAYAYARRSVDSGVAFRARMFAPGDGIHEDPATGSAVAALAGAIMRFDSPSEGEHLLRIEQGFEMGRPSTLELGMHVRGGRLAAASIGGHAVIVSDG